MRRAEGMRLIQIKKPHTKMYGAKFIRGTTQISFTKAKLT